MSIAVYLRILPFFRFLLSLFPIPHETPSFLNIYPYFCRFRRPPSPPSVHPGAVKNPEAVGRLPGRKYGVRRVGSPQAQGGHGCAPGHTDCPDALHSSSGSSAAVTPERSCSQENASPLIHLIPIGVICYWMIPPFPRSVNGPPQIFSCTGTRTVL